MNLRSRLFQAKTNVKVEKKTEGVAVEPMDTIQEHPRLEIQTLNEQEIEYKDVLHKKLLDVLDLPLIASIDPKEARKQISKICESVLNDQSFPVNYNTRQLLIEKVNDEILGLGPLEPLLKEPTVSDILVNGPKKIFVERFGRLEAVNIKFNNNAHLLKIIDRIVVNVGRRIDESSPLVDARLPDGSRVNAIIPPLALDGAALSIRRFSVDKLNLDDLVSKRSISEQMAEVFEAIVKIRKNILISGGTGSGKTTMLNAMSNYIPENERIVTIEDSAELQLQQEHIVRLETRPANIEGKGTITQRDLLKNALRMRPDRIVVGEVRGEEAFDMLQAMNTGHDGSLTTIHANTPRDSLARVENMVSMAGYDLPARTIRNQIASAIDVVLQLERQQDGNRRVTSMTEISGMEGEVITMSEIFKFVRTGLSEEGKVLGHFKATGIVPRFFETFKQFGIDLNIEVFN